MAFGNGTHQKEAQAGAANLPQGPAGYPIKTFKDSFQLRARNADAAILYPQDQPLLLFYRELDGYINVVARILHRIIQNVRHRSAQIFGIAADFRVTAVQRRLVTQLTGLQVMAGTGALHTLFNQLGKIQADVLPFASRLACFQDFINRAHQTISVFEHEPVEVTALDFVNMGLTLEGLKMKANGGNGRLQFMSDGVDETVVLLIAPDLSDQKTGVEDEARGDCAEEDDPEKDANTFAPIEDDPAKADRDRDRSQDDSEGEKEYDFAAPANPHAEILTRETTAQTNGHNPG